MTRSTPAIRIVRVQAGPRLDEVRGLWTEYGTQHAYELGDQDLTAEAAGLPAGYVPPDGLILAAVTHPRGHDPDLPDEPRAYRQGAHGDPRAQGATGGHPPESVVGIVGLKRFRGDQCEMKRMYVPAGGRGRGVGAALCEAIVAEARTLGFRRMLLDTSEPMTAARALYRRFGFAEVDAYYDESPCRDVVFMALDL